MINKVSYYCSVVAVSLWCTI